MRSKLLVGAVCVALIGAAAPVWAGGSGTKTFSNSDIHGTYAQKFNGFFGSAANPFPTTSSLPQSGIGNEIADGNGNFSAGLAFNIGGSTCTGTVIGTYHVSSDGTGTSTGTFTANASAPAGFPTTNYSCPAQMTGVQNEAFIIVSPDKINFISTDADSEVSGVAERQTHEGNHEHH